MTPEIITVLAILVAVIVILVTEWAPLEVLAMLVMGVLAVTDIVSPKEALAGFSNPAVVTIWAVFILSRRADPHRYRQYSRPATAQGRRRQGIDAGGYHHGHRPADYRPS